MRTEEQTEERPVFLRVIEFARLLRVGRTTAYEMLNTGQVRGIKINDKSWRIPRLEVDRLVAKAMQSAGDE
jgi:excisionase family DNA binding protein